ncbi:dihydroxyacetone kinase subunit DhaL [Streptacidiphilus sp. EB129]|uniref:dihydroxyacetone kinase subunit DhaL n=1 Tax=Streptacidiphilus sp. EB129 TaxID=3156262 RepID=UPI003518B031
MADLFDAGLARAWMLRTAAAVTRERDRLTELDAAIGDGDHGANLQRGFTAVVSALDSADGPSTPGAVLVTAGTTLISSVGGASGPLYGSALRALGKALATPTAGPDADAERMLAALGAARDALQRLGGAVAGDKTMVDVWIPAVAGFGFAVEGGATLAGAAQSAASAAEAAAKDTIPLQAHKGRASYLGSRSIGHQDPGATSSGLLFRSLAEVLTD